MLTVRSIVLTSSSIFIASCTLCSCVFSNPQVYSVPNFLSVWDLLVAGSWNEEKIEKIVVGSNCDHFVYCIFVFGYLCSENTSPYIFIVYIFYVQSLYIRKAFLDQEIEDNHRESVEVNFSFV